jgi:hypothetical protein
MSRDDDGTWCLPLRTRRMKNEKKRKKNKNKNTRNRRARGRRRRHSLDLAIYMLISFALARHAWRFGSRNGKRCFLQAEIDPDPGARPPQVYFVKTPEGAKRRWCHDLKSDAHGIYYVNSLLATFMRNMAFIYYFSLLFGVA